MKDYQNSEIEKLEKLENLEEQQPEVRSEEPADKRLEVQQPLVEEDETSEEEPTDSLVKNQQPLAVEEDETGDAELVDNTSEEQLPLIVEEVEQVSNSDDSNEFPSFAKSFSERPETFDTRFPLRRIIALLLVFCLIGGVAGGGIVYYTLSPLNPFRKPVVSELRPHSSGALLLDGEITLLESERNTIAVVEKSIGSVVQVLVSKETLDLGGFPGLTPPSQGGIRTEIQGNGTGFVFRSDGLIITNHHVVEGMDSIQVVLQNRKSYKATVIGSDKFSDLAVLKIEVTDKALIPLPLTDSGLLKVGQKAIAIGYPLASSNTELGLDRSATVSEGVISAVDRSYPIKASNGNDYTIDNLLQTSANINQGSSGGPLLNSSGEVIGVTSAGILSADGIGFAIPSATVYQVVTGILEGKILGKALLGVQSLSLDVLKESLGEKYSLLGLPVENGSMIVKVNPGSAAEIAGLQGATEEIMIGEETFMVGGDIIIRLNGTIIVGSNIIDEIRKYYPGDKIVLTVLRGEETLEISLVLGALTE